MWLRLMPITLLAEYHLSTGDIQTVLGFDIGAYNVTVNVLGIKSSDLQFGLAPYRLTIRLSDNMALTGALKWNYVMTKIPISIG